MVGYLNLPTSLKPRSLGGEKLILYLMAGNVFIQDRHHLTGSVSRAYEIDIFGGRVMDRHF